MAYRKTIRKIRERGMVKFGVRAGRPHRSEGKGTRGGATQNRSPNSKILRRDSTRMETNKKMN
jgi:hypothetical protein